MPRFRACLAVALLATLSGCDLLGPGKPTQRTLLVHHHAVECMGPWHQLCLLTREPSQVELTRHYFGIEGFAYEWGYVYTVRVEEHRIRNPPADGSSVRTVLTAVVTKERVPAGTPFELFLTAGDQRVVEVAPNRYRFYDAAEFACGDDDDCGALRTHIAAGTRIRYRFEHPAAPADPLRLVEWEACHGGPAGSNLCTP